MKAVQAELHRHLDMCTRLRTLWNIYKQRKWLPDNVSFDEFKDRVLLLKPLGDLRKVLASFAPFQKVLDTPQVIEQIGYEAVLDCYQEGSRLVELRYAPNFVSEHSHLDWAVVLHAFERGIKQALSVCPQMKVGLLLIGVRDFGPEQVDKAVDFYLNHSESFAGFDLAGNEDRYPCREFESSFRRLQLHNVPITVHAGEASGPESMWEAIELLGAKRIGHGIACVKDPVLMAHLSKHQICLENCPTSNWLTGAVKTLEEHPLPRILRAGVPVSINTDDPSIFGITLPHEIQVCQDKLGMTPDEISQCFAYANQHTFVR